MEKTMQNLAKAFIGESQARNRYTFYAKTAKKEGFERISEIFTITAENEKQHAKWFYRHLLDLNKKSGKNLDALTVEAVAPIAFSNTAENLKAAIEGEHEENSDLYPGFAAVADEEGLPEVAARFRDIAKAEVHHEKRYREILDRVESGTVFKKDTEKEWVCRECGYVHTGKEPPEKCPSCSHPRKYFEINCEEF
ncbi:MAG: rubrerythrin [Fibrobacterota bacterium]